MSSSSGSLNLTFRKDVLVVLIVLLGVGLGAGAVVAVTPSVDVLGWVTLLGGMVIIMGMAARYPKVAPVLLAAFTVRAVAALFHNYVAPLPDSQTDALAFERIGWEWAQGGLAGTLDHFTTGAYIYSWLISILYTLTDRSPLMIQGINVLFGSLIVWNIYRLAQTLWGNYIALRISWIAALVPTLILYSSITLREVAVVYPLTLGLIYLASWRRNQRVLHLSISLIAFAASIAFHTVVLAAFVAVAILVTGRWLNAMVVGRGETFLKYSLGLLVGSLVLGAIVLSGWGLEKAGGSIEGFSFDKLANEQEIYTRGRSAYPEALIARSPWDLVWQTPIRAVYFLFAPFPWMVRSPPDVFGLLDAWMYMIIAIFIYRSRHFIRASPAARAVFLVFLGMLLVLALGVSNYGAAVRHRAKLIPIELSLIAVPLLGSRREVVSRPVSENISRRRSDLRRR